MKCGQAEKWMDAALDELSGGEDLVPRGWSENRRAELEEHLTGCPQCRLQWNALRSAEVALRSPKPVAAPESLLVEFRQRLAAEADPLPRRAPERSRSPWGWIWPIGSLAAAGAAAATVLMFNVHVSPTAVVRGPTPVPSPTADRDPVRGSDFGVPGVRGLGGASAQKPEGPAATTPGTAGASDASTLAFERKPRRVPDDHLSAFKATALAEVNGLGSVRAKTRFDVIVPSKQLTSNTATRVATDFRRPQVEAKWSFDVYRTEPGTQLGVDAAGVRLAQNTEQNFFFGIQPGQVLYGTDAGPTAAQLTSQNANLAYAQVSLEPIPAELNVSAAVLAALQRPVEVELANAPVQEVADQLAQCADVVLRIDPNATLKFVTVREEGTPLWQVLQNVARQSELEVLPQDNALYLRQIVAQEGPLVEAAPAASLLAPYRAAKKESVKEPDRYAVKPAPALAPTGVTGPAGSAPLSRAVKAPAPTPSAPEHPSRGFERGRQPDRTVWPAAWGNLPERGFAAPPSDELPPLVLAPIVTKAPAPPAPQVLGRPKSTLRRSKAVRTRK